VKFEYNGEKRFVDLFPLYYLNLLNFSRTNVGSTSSLTLAFLLSDIRILQFKRPVKFEDVLHKAEVAFGQPMEMFYSTNDVRHCSVFVLSLADNCY